MAEKACLAVDLGTTSCKALVLSESLQPLGRGDARLDTIHPLPGASEQSLTDWWKAFVEASKEALSKAGDAQIEILSLSSQREGVVLLGEEGHPIRPAILWMDRRASKEAEELLLEFGEEWLSRTVGLVPSPGFAACILKWLKRNDPRTLDKARQVTQPKGYLILRLTGRRAIDLDLGPRFGFFDLKRRSYQRELVEWAGISESLLPELVEPNEVVGGLTDEAAGELGLKSGTPVVAGMGDRQCETLGLGLEPGREVMVATGMATNVSALTREIPKGLHAGVAKGPHLGGLYQLEVGIWASGAALLWLSEEFGPGKEGTKTGEFVIRLLEEFTKAEFADTLVVLPFFAGAGAPHWEPEIPAAIIGLKLGHTGADLVRATIESLAVEVAENVSLYKGSIPSIERVVHCGGGVLMESLNYFICNGCGLEVQIPYHFDSATIGAACLGLAMTLGADPFELAQEANPRKREIQPNPNGVHRFRIRREAQRKAHEAIRSLWRRLWK